MDTAITNRFQRVIVFQETINEAACEISSADPVINLKDVLALKFAGGLVELPIMPNQGTPFI